MLSIMLIWTSKINDRSAQITTNQSFRSRADYESEIISDLLFILIRGFEHPQFRNGKKKNRRSEKKNIVNWLTNCNTRRKSIGCIMRENCIGQSTTIAWYASTLKPQIVHGNVLWSTMTCSVFMYFARFWLHFFFFFLLTWVISFCISLKMSMFLPFFDLLHHADNDEPFQWF